MVGGNRSIVVETEQHRTRVWGLPVWTAVVGAVAVPLLLLGTPLIVAEAYLDQRLLDKAVMAVRDRVEVRAYPQYGPNDQPYSSAYIHIQIRKCKT